MAKPLTLLTHQKATFEWTPIHHTAFLTLKESVTQAPILHYLDPTKQYIVYTDVSDNACGAQLSQENDGTEFPIAFYHTLSWTSKGNGAPENKKLTEYTMQSQNGTITSKELKLSFEMTINHCQDFSMERMPTTK